MEKNGCTQIIRHANESRQNCSLRKLLPVIYRTLSNELSVRIDETAQNKLMENPLTKKNLLSTQVNEWVVLLKRWFCPFLQFDFTETNILFVLASLSLSERESLSASVPVQILWHTHTRSSVFANTIQTADVVIRDRILTVWCGSYGVQRRT